MRSLSPLHLLIFFFLFTLAVAQDTAVVDSLLQFQGPELHLIDGDRAHEVFDDEKALRYYSQAMEVAPDNYEALWKLARAYVDVGDTYTDIEKRKEYFSKGEKLSSKAVTVNPSGSKGHLYKGIALGRIALDTSAKERIRLSKAVKAQFIETISLDPRDDYAWHGLGRWHRKIATLSWIEKGFANMFLGGVPKEASVEKAVECFQKAVEINPGHINHHLELGLSYEKLKEKEKAIAAYKKVLELPKKDSDDDRYKKIATERLKKLEK